MPRCEECGSRKTHEEREDWIGIVAICALCFSLGALMSFNFITDYGFRGGLYEDGHFWYDIWVSYMTLGPRIIGIVFIGSLAIAILYILMVWWERNQ